VDNITKTAAANAGGGEMIDTLQKEKFLAATITLNGKPARIYGRLLPYAIVRPKDNQNVRVEYAWETVAHVIQSANGAFITR